MKHLLILTVGICLLISVPAIADQAEDEAAIRKVLDKFFAAYNKHDEKACAALWTETSISFTSEIKSRAALEEMINGIFERHKRSNQVKTLEDLGLNFLTADVAIVRQQVEFTNRYDKDGNPAPDRKTEEAWVFVKQNGTWMLAAGFERTAEE